MSVYKSSMGSDVTLAPTNIVTFNDENKTAIKTFEGLFELYKSKQLKTMLLTYGMNCEVAKSSKYKFDNIGAFYNMCAKE